MPAKLYVGNLAFSVTNEDLEALFGQIGKVDNVASQIREKLRETTFANAQIIATAGDEGWY